MSSTGIHRRRPKGYVRRSIILNEMRLREKDPFSRKVELQKRFTTVNTTIGKWQRVIEKGNDQFRDFVLEHFANTPTFRKNARAILRKVLIAEKRQAPLLRMQIVLNIISVIEDTKPYPGQERALWHRLNPTLKRFEQEEAMANRLLHDASFFNDWVDGRIARIIER